MLYILVVGTDVLDSTNQNTYKFGQLEEEDTWFELAENQQIHFENKKHFNSYLREEYHSIKVSLVEIFYFVHSINCIFCLYFDAMLYRYRYLYYFWNENFFSCLTHFFLKWNIHLTKYRFYNISFIKFVLLQKIYLY